MFFVAVQLGELVDRGLHFVAVGLLASKSHLTQPFAGHAADISN